MTPRNFFAELKRRNIYKVAVAYAIVGWLLIQIASTVSPTFHTPEWVLQTLVLLLALGLPVCVREFRCVRFVVAGNTSETRADHCR